ncbi:MAG: S8 family serine peptidase [Myxococcales bacterium]|nr:S8 family serine peptidase [Myxococcales bacterium]
MTTLRSSGIRWVTWVGAALLGVATSSEGTQPTRRAAAAPGASPAPRLRAPGRAPASPAPPDPHGVSRPAAAPAPAPTPIGYEHRDGEALVMSAPGRLDAVVADAARALGARLLGRVGEDVARLGLPPGGDLGAQLAALRALPGVVEAAPNAVTRGASWFDGLPPARVRPSMLWNLLASRWVPVDARGVTIALLDSGVAWRDHTDARGVVRPRAPWLSGVRVVSPRDALHGDDAPDDASNHGTHLASILVGYPGLAAGASLMPVQVLEEDLAGTEAALIAGLDWARTHGARVANLSLAFGRGYYPSRALDRAVHAALRAGVVLVAAAGNGGDDDVRFPAAFPGVVAVGAGVLDGPGNSRLSPAAYATTGAALDLLAPGGDLTRDLNRDGVPDGILGVTFDPERPDRFGPWLFAGSSQAAAQVTAAAARLIALGVAPSEVPARLRASASPLSRGGDFDPRSGAGALDVARSTGRAPAPERTAVQLAASLVRRGAEVGAVAAVAVRGHDGSPQASVEVLARWRGGAERAVRCTTDRAGVCYLDAGVLRGPRRIALLEVQGVVDRRGALDRPDEAFWYEHEVLPAAEALASRGEGDEATLLWAVPAGRRLIPGEAGLESWLLRGFALGSALAPSVMVLDAPAVAWVTGRADPDGTGFGRSSVETLFFTYDVDWFVGAMGFGRSSLPEAWSYTSSWSWGAWGGLDAFASVSFKPAVFLGASVGATDSLRAASVDDVRGAGEGVPLP